MNDNLDPESGSGTVERLSASDSLMKATESASSADNVGETVTETTVKPGADTTVQPENLTETQPPAGQPGKPGEAPENRIQAAVRNARAEVEKQYEAFKGLDPQQVRTGMALLAEIQADPRAFAEQLMQRLGMTLPQGEPEPAPVPAEFKMPEADLVSADGKLRTFSEKAVAALVQNLTQHLTGQFTSQLKPIQEFVSSEQTSRQVAEEKAQMLERVNSAVESIKGMPHYDEQGVLSALRGMDKGLRAQLGPVGALHHAYSLYLRDSVFPTIDSQAEQRVRDGFKRKAAASEGTVQPNGTAGQAKKPSLQTADDLAAHMARMADAIDG